MADEFGFVERHVRHQIDEALETSRVVVLHGARQSGKTTLAKQAAAERRGSYASLDDDALLSAAIDDPVTFLSAGTSPRVIDEVQRGGDRLIRAVKLMVDEDPRPGRFLLTGSTNFLTVPTISESLAGRVRLLHLRPLSRAELSGRQPSTLEAWHAGTPDLASGGTIGRSDYLEMVCQGGFPGAIALGRRLDARAAWFEDYAATVVGRDLGLLAAIRDEASMGRLLAWAAASTAAEINVAATARRLGISRPTLSRYLEWLRAVFLIDQIPAWSRNALGRAIRRPKLHLGDSGIAAALAGTSAQALAEPASPDAGRLLETFVVNEIARQLSSVPGRPALRHYRDRDGREIDLIVEWRDGSIVAAEVKATQSPTTAGLAHVAWLRDRLDAVSQGAFRAGVLLHTGHQNVKVGDRLFMVPIDSLWAP